MSQTIVTVQNMRKQDEVGFQEFILAYKTDLRTEGKGESPIKRCQWEDRLEENRRKVLDIPVMEV